MVTQLGQTISYDIDDLHGGQRSTEVKCVNLCCMATTCGQIYRYYKQGKDHDDLHEGHLKVIKGQIVNHAIWLSEFVRRTTESNWRQLCPQ